ncbi:MAG: hypothetical protein ABL921_08575 [Pirellula sp.]
MRFPLPFKDLIPIDAVKQLSQLVAHPAWVTALKDAAQKLGIKDQLPTANLQQALQQAGRWMESISEPWMQNAQPGLNPGINATGEFFSSRWCTHRMALEVIAMHGYIQSQFAETNKLESQLKHMLMGVTGAPAALVLPNMSIALYLVALMKQSTENPSWVLPRMDCIRLPQAGCMPAGNLRTILDSVRAKVVEIGSTQDCTVVDFQESLRSANATLLLASPNSASQESRIEHRQRAQAAAMESGATIIEIVIDGSINDLAELGLPCRMLSDCWNKSTEFLIVPGDGLMGGPESGIVLGTKQAVEALQRLADSLGWSASCATKAMLLKTLQTTETVEKWRTIPIGTALTTSVENLENRSRRLETQLGACSEIDRIVVLRKSVRIGAGVWAFTKLDSSVLQLFPKSMTPSAYAEKLSMCRTPIWGNVQSDHVELVMRSVEPDEDRQIVQLLTEG